ncbi:MAG: hypothetical protein AVDCRST_MAG18-802 [uncultured Thermomicrobiales bacterium]|uniref:DUF5615 domain-containing protein n=1 Tax=uncultured Thermomicrobiales bacterium TaxID=1645740 RepID=A0A6J4UV92_9BACT|nr:MAG: hypothetical protein AVDCRST_MAG18-802 [uncultured Thermomicrobiales bacterium]
MARLYADENFPFLVVERLRGLGHNVLTSREAGNAGCSVPDEDVLSFAIAERRAVLTLNPLHVIRLHRATPAHAGIIVCTFDADFVGQAARIDQVIHSTGELAGCLLRVNRHNLSQR